MRLVNEVIDVVARCLKVDRSEVNISSGLGITHKWDSLNHTNLVLELEEVFDVDFDFDELEQVITVQAIVNSLESKGIAA
ncbi:acyl carrier protein [Oceanisphaera sp. KMM 10153]|uniref:acyl carrier protein n=1 Tax=Oceanisphaera submarina TaxID=3390193 RepID=UPI0039759C83